MTLAHVVKDIHSLKVQGARAVAEASLGALHDVALHSPSTKVSSLLRELRHARTLLERTRPTEPCMRNSIRFVFQQLQSPAVATSTVQEAKQRITAAIKKAYDHFSSAEKRISRFGARKILQDMTVYTHCHSSAVIDVFKAAKQQGKRFAVHNTETRPSFQGRITATQLARLHIPITHYVDAAVRFALRKADMVLLGADAITAEGEVINKVGTHLVVELARRYDLPVFICTDSWKFDPLTIQGFWETIELRDAREVWEKRPSGVAIKNYAFEGVEPDLVSGIISELGVFKPEVFIEEVKAAYPWMFIS